MVMNTSYAIVKAGGKQYRVVVGGRVKIDKVTADVGSEVEFPDVLLIHNGESSVIGSPTISGGLVKARVTRHLKDPKVIIFKKRRRKGYTKKQGHRQERTEIVIEHINF